MELDLKLKGLLQSYGGENPWTAIRHTNTKPTETAVRGMVECALGLAQTGTDEDDDMTRQDIWDHVNILIHDPDLEHTAKLLVDDQNARPLFEDMKFRCADGGSKDTLPQIRKEYIFGGCFFVTLSGDDDYIQKIRYRLQHPVYPYSLGRACCIPSEPVVIL